jgi:hypothetical protein
MLKSVGIVFEYRHLLLEGLKEGLCSDLRAN